MKELLKVRDIAERMCISPNRVYQLMSSGELPSVRVGGAIRIPADAWEQWLGKKSREAMSEGARKAETYAA